MNLSEKRIQEYVGELDAAHEAGKFRNVDTVRYLINEFGLDIHAARTITKAWMINRKGE